MNTITRAIKRPRDESKSEDNVEERKKLTESLHETEKAVLFNEWKVKDVQKEVQARERIIREKEQQIELLKPLYEENITLRRRIEDLESKMFTQVRLCQSLDIRIQRQADDLARVHQKKIEDARNAAMQTIGENVQKLQNLFQKCVTDPKLKEEWLGSFVEIVDSIRTAVGINLI